MVNRVTKAEREALQRVAGERLLAGGLPEAVVATLVMTEGVSHERARQAVAKVIRRWRGVLVRVREAQG